MLKTKKTLLIEAHNEQMDVITAIRLSLLSALNDLADIGGKDDYDRALEAIVNASGTDGISLAQLRTILPDAAKLTDAREALLKVEKIVETEDKKSIIVKPGSKAVIAVNAAATVEEEKKD